MSDPIPSEWHRLFGAALNDTLSTVEKTRLADVLRDSAEARQLWFLYTDNECGLAELKNVLPQTSERAGRAGRAAWRTWNPLHAAAAGLLFGLFSASMLWAYVGLSSNRESVVLVESFETGPGPLVKGMLVEAGTWSGDYSEVVGNYHGVNPAEGGKMLRFRSAAYEGKPVRDGWVADLFRIVDLKDARWGIAHGDAALGIGARFSALPQEGMSRLSCGVTVYALDALPPAGERDDVFLKRGALAESLELSEPGPRILATAARSETQMASEGLWQPVSSEMRLPAETRYVMIHLRAHLHGSHRAEVPKPVEFVGLFLDDIRLTLTHRSPLP